MKVSTEYSVLNNSDKQVNKSSERSLLERFVYHISGDGYSVDLVNDNGDILTTVSHTNNDSKQVNVYEYLYRELNTIPSARLQYKGKEYKKEARKIIHYLHLSFGVSGISISDAMPISQVLEKYFEKLQNTINTYDLRLCAAMLGGSFLTVDGLFIQISRINVNKIKELKFDATNF